MSDVQSPQSSTALVLRLEYLCAQKDIETAQMRSQFIVERLRQELGQPLSAVFNPSTLSFVEVPTEAPPSPSV